MEETKEYSTNISFISMPQSVQIVWKIPDFFSLPEAPKVYRLESAPFNFANAKWCIRLYPNQKYGSYYTLVRSNSLALCHEIVLSFCIESNKKYFYFEHDKFTFEEDCEMMDGTYRPTKAKLFDKRLELAPDGNLTLVWHILCEESERNVFSQEVLLKEDGRMNRNDSNISLISMPQPLKIVWKIPDFFPLPEDSEDYRLDSPPFIFANAKWCIRLYPNNEGGLFYELVRLNSLAPCHEIILISCMEWFDIHFKCRYHKFIFDDNCEMRCENLASKTELCDQLALLSVGSLTLVWHMLCEESVKNVVYQEVLHKVDSRDILCQDLKNLLLNGHDCDLTLKVNDKEFQVHRNILKARSEVFDSMLTHDMIEKNSGVIDIPDCEPQVMEQFLLYLYSGNVEALNEKTMLGLYYTADKYHMTSLKDECCSFIHKSVAISNICDILKLALNHNDKILLERATNFFVNNTNEILITVEWMAFLKENDLAANELFIKASKKWNQSKTTKTTES